MGLFSILFGKANNQLKEILQQGAKIIDVRTAMEFRNGHVQGSINIPLDQLHHKVGKLKKIKAPLVLCCASGARSAAATNILRGKNITNVYNGGRWIKVDRLLNN